MKYALLIGNNEYSDKKLAQLKTPEADAHALAKVLRAKKIGNFDEVALLVNQTEAKSRRAISAFLSNKKPDDLVLLYFSGHGVLDGRGSLFLALKDTQTESLNATAISSSFISYEMDNCRSKRQILILDCCNSGAFARGTKGEQKAVTESTFEGSGSGRVVLTASDSTQFAFEGDQVIKQSELSLFTHFLLEGLKTGEADRNNDGKVSLDEWYDYSYSKVTASTPQQIPHKWSYNQQGDLVIAQNPFVKSGSAAIISSPLRTMLDQKQYEYRQHKLLLNSKELEIIADDLEQIELGLTDSDKQLLLFSGAAQGNADVWLKLSGVKGLEWLGQACLDESCPLEVRSGAAAHLGRREDQQAFKLLLDCSQQEPDLEKRRIYLDLLAAYLNNSQQRHSVPGKVHRALFPRLAPLAMKEGSAERAHMSRQASLIAPVCALIAFFLSRSSFVDVNVVGGIIVVFVAIVLGFVFGQVITSLALISRRWLLGWQLILMAVMGSALGAILFIFLGNQMIVGLSGGVIAIMQALQYRRQIKLAAAILSILAVVLIFPFAILVSHPAATLTAVGYAFSSSLFSFVYVYSVGKQR
jgi:hypothetical protein